MTSVTDEIETGRLVDEIIHGALIYSDETYNKQLNALKKIM